MIDLWVIDNWQNLELIFKYLHKLGELPVIVFANMSVTKILHQKVVDLFTCKLSFTALDLDLDKHLGRAHWYTVHLPTSYLWQSYYLPEKTSKNNFLAVALRSARMPRHWPNRVRISTRLFKFRCSSQNATMELKSSAQFEWPFVDLIFTLK